MAATWTTEKLPRFETEIRRFVEQHLELDDEPLHLAFSYGVESEPDDIFVFEVIGGYGDELISQDRELFEVVYMPSPLLTTGLEQPVHLVLTNRNEVAAALRDRWPSMDPVSSAMRNGDYQVIHSDEIGRTVLDCLVAASRAVEESVRG